MFYFIFVVVAAGLAALDIRFHGRQIMSLFTQTWSNYKFVNTRRRRRKKREFKKRSFIIPCLNKLVVVEFLKKNFTPTGFSCGNFFI